MKFSLIAVLVVFALAQGSESFSLVKREAPDVSKITKFFQDVSDMLRKSTDELMEKIKAHEMTGHAQSYIEGGTSQLQPYAEHLQQQLKPLADSIEEQLKPLAESVQAQIKPITDNVQNQMEMLWKQIIDQTKPQGAK